METKKFKIKSDGSKPKGGRNNTQTILTAAGVSAVGSAGLGYAFGRVQQQSQDAADTPTQQQTTNQPDQEQNPQTTNQNNPNTSGEGITEPQPTDSTQNQIAQNQTGNHDQPVPDNEEINPDQVAQEIAQANEIDSNDNDAADMLTVDGMTTAYGPDGSEMLVAIVHTPDGGQYLLADADGDGHYNEVFDMEGNYMGDAEGNLTASDLEEMADTTGGYLAQMDGEPVGDDPTGDIIDTLNDTPDDSSDIASNDIYEEEISDEEIEDLVNQLLDDEEDEDLLAERVVDEDDEDDAESSDDSDTDIDNDIDSDEA